VSLFGAQYPLDEINSVLEATHAGTLERRAVLAP